MVGPGCGFEGTMEGKYAEDGDGKYDDEKNCGEGKEAAEEGESDMGGEASESTRLFERVKEFCMSQVRTSSEPARRRL